MVRGSFRPGRSGPLTQAVCLRSDRGISPASRPDYAVEQGVRRVYRLQMRSERSQWPVRSRLFRTNVRQAASAIPRPAAGRSRSVQRLSSLAGSRSLKSLCPVKRKFKTNKKRGGWLRPFRFLMIYPVLRHEPKVRTGEIADVRKDLCHLVFWQSIPTRERGGILFDRCRRYPSSTGA